MKKIFYPTAFLLLSACYLFLISCGHKGNMAETIKSESDSGIVAQRKILDFWNLYHSAQEYKASHEFLKAKQEYEKALQFNPSHEDALFNFGNMCYELGDYHGAKEAWERLIRVNPMNTRAHYQLGNLYLRYDNPEFFNLDRSVAEFKKALDLNREVTGPLLHLGQLYLIKQDFEQADKYFTAVTGTDPRGVEAYFQKGFIHWKHSNNIKALEYFKEAVRLSLPDIRKDNIPIEGDTKNGKSLKRDANQSTFYEYFNDLNGIENNSITLEMNKRYKAEDNFIIKLKKINSDF